MEAAEEPQEAKKTSAKNRIVKREGCMTALLAVFHQRENERHAAKQATMTRKNVRRGSSPGEGGAGTEQDAPVSCSRNDAAAGGDALCIASDHLFRTLFDPMLIATLLSHSRTKISDPRKT